MIPEWFWNALFLASWSGLFSFRCHDLSGYGLVITDKHTKLRGLLVLKQKKRKERDRRRASVEWWMRGRRPNVFLKGRGWVFENREKDKIEDMI